MREQWDFYLCQVDDLPASIYLDLGWSSQAPSADLPCLAWLRIFMKTPREDGLSSQDEFDALIALEDALMPSLADDTTVYVGRNTSAGFRDLYFYTTLGTPWESRVEAAMRGQQYAFECGQRDEPDWWTYREFLYPDPETRQRMSNRSVCWQLEKAGDALVLSREISHWAYFSDAIARDAYVAQAEALGFQQVVSEDAEPQDGQWTAKMTRCDVPAFDRIDDVCLPLYRLALQLNGRYDGWETSVERESTLQ
ncbi:Regulator of ribonuclease activity B [Pseudoxanthomonas sp. GM95]|uniref:DUF695 domain-containing protein n=1 Tax=Pseudoxanthomonas sp. GM95 TaxID=1881043 RepID=UPI0008D55B9C|nr:DUF695 domain-containing protein [Pseudoxanthomonas sp. GM95]SEL79223.1 Regulator of ribonuclease activity B [Pseudoxanthomonas sp. GM95]